MLFQEGSIYTYMDSDSYKFTNIRFLPHGDGIQVDLIRVSDGKFIPGYRCGGENYHRWKKRDRLKLLRKERIK